MGGVIGDRTLTKGSELFDPRPYFLTGANFKIILTQTVIVAVCALGMTMIIVSGGIDLSVGSIVALTGVVGAVAIEAGWSTPLPPCLTPASLVSCCWMSNAGS